MISDIRAYCAARTEYKFLPFIHLQGIVRLNLWGRIFSSNLITNCANPYILFGNCQQALSKQPEIRTKTIANDFNLTIPSEIHPEL